MSTTRAMFMITFQRDASTEPHTVVVMCDDVSILRMTPEDVVATYLLPAWMSLMDKARKDQA